MVTNSSKNHLKAKKLNISTSKKSSKILNGNKNSPSVHFGERACSILNTKSIFSILSYYPHFVNTYTQITGFIIKLKFIEQDAGDGISAFLKKAPAKNFLRILLDKSKFF